MDYSIRRTKLLLIIIITSLIIFNKPIDGVERRQFTKDQYHASEFYIYISAAYMLNAYWMETQIHLYFENSTYVADVMKHLTHRHVWGPGEELPEYNGTNLGIIEEKYINERYTIYPQDFKLLVDFFENNLKGDVNLSPNALAQPAEIIYKIGDERISLKFQFNDLGRPGFKKYSFILGLLNRNIPNMNMDPSSTLFNWDEK